MDSLDSRLDELEQQARALAAGGNWGDRALEVNTAILSIGGLSVPALNRLARCHLEAGRRDLALRAYKMVLKIDSKNKIAASGIERSVDPVERAVQRHKALIQKSGRPYLGVRPAGTTHHRVTHCWRCHHLLDNAVDIECVGCGWIICLCGACGCTRS